MSSSGKALMAEIATQPDPAAEPGRPIRTGQPAQPGRAAQRRRTRRAIVEATSGLLAAGADPSINDIAAAADVSRRTIYTYFPTLDQLLLDATLGAMNVSIEAAIDSSGEPDARARIAALVAVLSDGMRGSLPLGRKLIKLTVDAPPSDAGPKRGYRRIGWIEAALEPVRPRLGPDRFEQPRLRARGSDRLGGVRRALRRARPQRESGPARSSPAPRPPSSTPPWLARPAGTGAAGTGAGTDSDSPN